MKVKTDKIRYIIISVEKGEKFDSKKAAIILQKWLNEEEVT